MFCLNCGNELNDGSLVCPVCGAEVPSIIVDKAASQSQNDLPDANEPEAVAEADYSEPEAYAEPEVSAEPEESEVGLQEEYQDEPVAAVEADTSDTYDYYEPAAEQEEAPVTASVQTETVPEQKKSKWPVVLIILLIVIIVISNIITFVLLFQGVNVLNAINGMLNSLPAN